MKGTPGQGTVSSALMPNVSTLQSWYAVHTHSRHENKVAAGLAEKSVTTFLPTVRSCTTGVIVERLWKSPCFPAMCLYGSNNGSKYTRSCSARPGFSVGWGKLENQP